MSHGLADLGGLDCWDSFRIHCAVSVGQNLKFSVRRVFEYPDFEFELDPDREKPQSLTVTANEGIPPNPMNQAII